MSSPRARRKLLLMFILCTLMLSFCLLGSGAYSQDRHQEAESPSRAPDSSAPTGGALPTSVQAIEVKYEAGKLSVKAEKADLAVLLKKVSEAASITVEIGEGVIGSATISFVDLSLEQGITRILEAVGEENYAAEFRKVGQGDKGYLLHKIVVVKKGAKEVGGDGKTRPPSQIEGLDPTEIPGMKIDKEAARYLGQRKRVEYTPVLKPGEKWVNLGWNFQSGVKFDLLTVIRDGKYYYRIQDKQGNTIFECPMSMLVSQPYMVEEKEVFLTSSKREKYSEDSGAEYGIKIYNFKGELIGEITPDRTGVSANLATSNDGVMAVIGFNQEKFLGFDLKGKKLWEMEPGVSTPPFFSEDGRYLAASFRTSRADEKGQMGITDEDSLIDTRQGKKLISLNNKWEAACRFVAFSPDSKYAAYQKRQDLTDHHKTYLVDLSDFKEKEVFPIRNYPVALSNDASYVAALDTEGEWTQGQFKKVFKLFDKNTRSLVELFIEQATTFEQLPRDSIVFKYDDSIVQLTYKEKEYYFQILSKERQP